MIKMNAEEAVKSPYMNAEEVAKSPHHARGVLCFVVKPLKNTNKNLVKAVTQMFEGQLENVTGLCNVMSMDVHTHKLSYGENDNGFAITLKEKYGRPYQGLFEAWARAYAKEPTADSQVKLVFVEPCSTGKTMVSAWVFDKIRPCSFSGSEGNITLNLTELLEPSMVEMRFYAEMHRDEVARDLARAIFAARIEASEEKQKARAKPVKVSKK